MIECSGVGIANAVRPTRGQPGTFFATKGVQLPPFSFVLVDGVVGRCVTITFDGLIFALERETLLRRWTDLTTPSPSSSVHTLRDHFLTSLRPYSSADMHSSGPSWW